MEMQFADGVVLCNIGNVLHCADMAFSVVGTSDESVAPFPKGIGKVGFSLEITCTEGTKKPIGTGYIVSVELQHTWEISPTEHIVNPLGIDTCYPLVTSFFAISEDGVSDETGLVFLYPGAGGDTHRQDDEN